MTIDDTGRFTSLDPLGNGYQYAYDSPTLLVDPSGLVPCTRCKIMDVAADSNGWSLWKQRINQLQSTVGWLGQAGHVKPTVMSMSGKWFSSIYSCNGNCPAPQPFPKSDYGFEFSIVGASLSFSLPIVGLPIMVVLSNARDRLPQWAKQYVPDIFNLHAKVDADANAGIKYAADIQSCGCGNETSVIRVTPKPASQYLEASSTTTGSSATGATDG